MCSPSSTKASHARSVRPPPGGAELAQSAIRLGVRQYASAAQLGSTAFSAGGSVVTRPFGQVGGDYPQVGSTFYAPGAPRTFWVGLRYSL